MKTEDLMKTILCYGDSLTWGYNPDGPSRHAHEDRWPSVLQGALGEGALVIPDGLNGRTTAFDDYMAAADRNGARLLPTVLTTHAPLDLVILMLGANDMKPYICGHAIGSKLAMERLVGIVKSNDYPFGVPAPKILIVAPPALRETDNPDFRAGFAGGMEQSRMLAPAYAEVAEQTGCVFFDAGTVAETSPLDGIHLDAQNTRAVGKGLEPVARMMLGL